MSALLKLLVFAGLTLAAVVRGTFFIFSLFSGASAKPGSSAWEKAVAQLRSRVNSLAEQLIPWDSELPALLSTHQTNWHKAGFWNSETYGIFTTIYQEPAVAIASKASGNTSLTLAAVGGREFVFRTKSRETEIWQDGQPLGVLVDGVMLSAGKTSRQLARIENTSGEAQPVLNINNLPVAVLSNSEMADSPMPRAATLLRELKSDEENIALALIIFQMTKGSKSPTR